MCYPKIVLLVVLGFLISIPALGQQIAPTGETNQTGYQALSLIKSALAASGITVPITDVTLTGTARRIAGSDDETGTAVMKAMATGEARVDLNFPSGQHSEVVANSANGPVGQWSASGGLPHAISLHNLMTDSAWFFPALVISRLASSKKMALSYIGQETKNGHSVLHITATSQLTSDSAEFVTLMQHLNQIDLFLDSTSMLPVALAFNVHPDDNLNVDIPIEIDFSDYRATNGVQVPYHVQKYLNNGLVLDLEFQTVELNRGMSASVFQVQ